jgi:hypothetical protein
MNSAPFTDSVSGKTARVSNSVKLPSAYPTFTGMNSAGFFLATSTTCASPSVMCGGRRLTRVGCPIAAFVTPGPASFLAPAQTTARW